MNARGRLNPTNGVGGSFILSLQSEAALPLPLHLSRPPRGREAGARDEQIRMAWTVQASRQCMNDPPTPLVVLDNDLYHLPSD
jgi:hypothetical protein